MSKCCALIGLESRTKRGMQVLEMNCPVMDQCNAVPKRLSRFRKPSYRFHAATRPPRHPTAIPPMMSTRQSSRGRNRMDDRFSADANGTR